MSDYKSALLNFLSENLEIIDKIKDLKIIETSKDSLIDKLEANSNYLWVAEKKVLLFYLLKELLEITELENRQDIDVLQDKTSQWIRDTFGSDPINDDLKIDRSNRFLEEAIELVQAVGMERENAHKLVDYVFDRQVGETFQEVGGVLITLSALTTNLHHKLSDCWNRELVRVIDKMELIRKKDKMKKENSPLPGDLKY